MRRAQSTVTLQHSVDVQKLLANPKKELMPVLRALPEWNTAAPHQVMVSQISGALTNLIYRCQHLPTGQYVLARIFGTSGVLFDREEEQQIFAAVAHAGLGPKLLASFENGRLEEFLLDQSITASQMRTTPVAICVAAAMAIFNFTHLTRLPQKGSSAEATCWDRMRKWARAAQDLYTPTELEAEGLSNIEAEIDALEKGITGSGPTWMGFCHNDTQYGNMLLHTAAEPSLEGEDLVDARNSLELQPASSIDGPRVLLGSSPPSFSNLALAAAQGAFSVVRGSDIPPASDPVWSYEKPEDLDESQGGSPRKHPRGLTTFSQHHAAEATDEDATADPRLSVRFIDYEYAGPNPVAFDIANHWCEWGADYHAAIPHHLDYSKFPTEEQQLRFTRAYVAAAVALKQRKEELGLPTRADSLTRALAASAAAGASRRSSAVNASIQSLAEQLRETALAYVPVSHLQWGIWGLLQARLSNVPSFDFAEYGRQRLREWRRLRPDFVVA